jgi:diguanylate cyclase (GGDEF)-like protein
VRAHVRSLLLALTIAALVATPAAARAQAAAADRVAILGIADALVPGAGCAGGAVQIARLPGRCFVPAAGLRPSGTATFWSPATLWLRFAADAFVRPGVAWTLVVPTYVTDGELTVVDAHGAVRATRRFGASIAVAEREYRRHDIWVSVPAVRGDEVVIRVTSPFSVPAALRVQTVASLDAADRASMRSVALPLAFFNGGAMTMALFNVVLFAILRRRIYLLYAAAIGALVLFQLVSTGAAWTVLWPHLPLRDDYPPYVAWIAYVALIVWFTRAFLDLPRTSPAADRVLLGAFALLIADSAIYVAVPDALQASGAYAWLDPVSTAAQVGAMLGAGIVALRRGVSGAAAYVVAFAGSAAGIVFADAITYAPGPASLREYAYLPTACGVAWESIFLALALGLRVRDAEHDAARLSEFAFRDALTGIANRRAFDEALAREWNRAQRNAASVALVVFDIDHFKAYNDRFGHPAGDARLVAVARAVAQAARREGDLAARFGGEEFVLLLPNTSLEDAFAIAEQVRVGIARLADEGGVTVSAGVAATIARGSDPATLVGVADAALYAAKAGGRDRTMRADPARV